MKKHRLGIFMVFCILLAVFVLEICALVQSKWWTCDVTAKAPINNVTLHSKDMVTLTLKMRTSLLDTCWHVETTPGPAQRTLFTSSVITKCLLEDFKTFRTDYNSTTFASGKYNMSFERLEDSVLESRSGFRKIQISLIVCLVFLAVSIVIGLINVFVCNGCLVLSNLVFVLSASICTIASVISSSSMINYQANFDVFNRSLVPLLLVWSESVTNEGKDLLKLLFRRLDKVQALRHKCLRGETFTINWACLVLLSVAFFVSVLSHIMGLRSDDVKYKAPIYASHSNKKGGRRLNLQSDHDMNEDI